MKRERRQELKENELAELLGRWLQKVAPYSQTILIAVLVIVVLYAGWSVWGNWSRRVEQDAWNALYTALETGGPAELETVAETYPRTDAAAWAKLVAADYRLRDGCREMLTNKANAAQELRKAIDGYLSIRNEAVSPLFQQRVLWGLARAYEALSGTRQGQGELENAIKFYQELSDRWPNGPYATLAQRRIAFLKKPENQQFYDRFAAYEPPRPTQGGSTGEPSPGGAAPTFTAPEFPPTGTGVSGPGQTGSSPTGGTEGATGQSTGPSTEPTVPVMPGPEGAPKEGTPPAAGTDQPIMQAPEVPAAGAPPSQDANATSQPSGETPPASGSADNTAEKTE